MRLVFGLVLIVGLGLAGFAVHMAKGYIDTYQTELARERAARQAIVPTVDVLIAGRALRYGEVLRKDDITAVKWPENAIPEGTFSKMEELFPEGEQELRSIVRAMEKGEAVMAVKVTEPGEDAGVSSRLGQGMRAFALRVDVASGVSGFLRPGDRVDVYWTGRSANLSDGAESVSVTKLIQPNMSIIAVDQTADQDRNNPLVARTVTVEATPQQVAALAQAQSTGNLSLSLLGAADEGDATKVAIDQNTLLGIEAKEPVFVKEKRVCTVRTRKGAEIVEVPIACSDD